MLESSERPRPDESALRSLQSQKSRLESVILDAHKLISEKDDELSALSGELEGNRKLIEKLEGQVLQGRTEVGCHLVAFGDDTFSAIIFVLAVNVVR